MMTAPCIAVHLAPPASQTTSSGVEARSWERRDAEREASLDADTAVRSVSIEAVQCVGDAHQMSVLHALPKRAIHDDDHEDAANDSDVGASDFEADWSND